MPADYQSTAQGLSVSPSLSRSSSPRTWTRGEDNDDEADRNPNNQRRLSTAPFRSVALPTGSQSSSESVVERAYAYAQWANNYSWEMWNRSTPLQRVLGGLSVAILCILLIVGWIFSHRVFGWLGEVSESWRALPGGWLIVFLLVCMTSMPPMIGYSTACTIGGFVYGFPLGWPIVASACVVGSLASFMACRTIMSRRVHRFIGSDPRFVALGEVLRRDGILYLTGVRFCPLPFSISNGFLATLPSITPFSFALSTAISSPKLLVHVFIGSRLAILAESGDDMSFGDRLINYLGMAAGGAVGVAVGWIIYKRTMTRAAELARDNLTEEGRAGGLSPSHTLPADYADQEEGLIDPEDAAALMSDDDISLWETPAADPVGYGDDYNEDSKKIKRQRQDSW
ncbi:putative membrane protein YdjX, TVP38/TMEM64 family, SNARE-associated domain [Geosmithia morbida]|uniref:Golgi apparatus membrane protein TVP38 n=1 Tax=Geosmithia morbida TaxID=1094350 RepID=A0A9P4YVZ9_9HYPO|nr:putative membrane protein YdjX, TVP38/TMEM64 family, SNARE-associated domain [Geosmithia morbida]KAF4123552.1 putative membrane protein YdjX, TVP38/TMEM64 family, SNARE-associated domain [Geosmithia morbida]